MLQPRHHLLRIALLLGFVFSHESFASDDEEYMNSSEIHGGGLVYSVSDEDVYARANSNYNPFQYSQPASPDLPDFVVGDDVVEYESDAPKATKKRAAPTPAPSLEEEGFPSIEFSDDLALPVKKAAPPVLKKVKPVAAPPVIVKAKAAPAEKATAAQKKRVRKDKEEAGDLPVAKPSSRGNKALEKASPKSAPIVVAANDNIKKPEKILRVADPQNVNFRGKTVAILDFETTSFSPGIGGRAVSLGILLLKDGVETLRWEAIFNPGKDSNKGAFKAHGISRSVTRNKPYFYQQADEIFGILSQANVVVAHNAKFDYRYLLAEFQQAGMLKKIKGWNLKKLLADNSPLDQTNREFIQQQLAWVDEDAHIQAKRLGMLQNRLATALWLYLEARKVLTDNYLYDPKTGRFGVPFLPMPDKPVTGYAANVNEALHSLFIKLSAIEGKTQAERERINWKKFDGIDISERPEFTPQEKRRKELFDRQIKATNVVKKFTFLELGWDKVYDWRRVEKKSSVFYNKTDRDILNQITGFLNLAKALVDLKLYKHDEEVPAFLNYEATWHDTYALAKDKLKKGQDISGYKLDDLCDFYGVDRSSRKDGHGALIDSDLLAKVYANLLGTEMVEVAVNDNIAAKPAPQASDFEMFDDEAEVLPAAPAKKAPAKRRKADPKADSDLIGGIF